jgi:protein-S-isoprenylcysteine O-methyltransferase Ste14
VGGLVGAAAGAFLVRDLDPSALLSELAPLMPSGVLWLAFFSYWAVASRTEAPTTSSEAWLSTTLHQLLLVTAMALLFVPVIRLFAVQVLPRTLAVAVVGLSVQAVAMILGIWARRHLGRNWSAEVRIAVSHQLVRSGPYRRVRHPIYTAMLGMFLGTAIISGQPHALLAVLVLAAAYWRKMSLEERFLLETFGVDYASYCRASWRLLPWVY